MKRIRSRKKLPPPKSDFSGKARERIYNLVGIQYESELVDEKFTCYLFYILDFVKKIFMQMEKNKRVAAPMLQVIAREPYHERK